MRRRLLERLEEHQRGILTIMDAGEAMIGACDVSGIARIRWTLVRALTAYQLFKHRDIFDPAIAGERRADSLRAERLKMACLTLGDDFRGFVQKWGSADVAGQWPLYEKAALAMTGRIRSHIARERAEVALLLAS